MKPQKEKQEQVNILVPKKEVVEKQPEKAVNQKPFTPKKTSDGK